MEEEGKSGRLQDIRPHEPLLGAEVVGVASKKVTLASLLLAGTGVPYLLNDPDAQATLNKAMSSLKSVSSSAPGVPGLEGNSSGSAGFFSSLWSETPGSSAAAPPTYPLNELIRFDVSPRWVIEHFPRVTTTYSEHGYEGLRVPIVTGVTPADVAGSLTYYFDKQHRVQRLTLHGYTGDDAQIVPLVVQHYHLEAEQTLGTGLYTIKWNGRPISALRICHAPMIQSASKLSWLEVRLEINRPEGAVKLSDEFQQLLDHDRHIQHW